MVIKLSGFLFKSVIGETLLSSELIADIRFPSVIIVTGVKALLHYDLFAISTECRYASHFLICVVCETSLKNQIGEKQIFIDKNHYSLYLGVKQGGEAWHSPN